MWNVKFFMKNHTKENFKYSRQNRKIKTKKEFFLDLKISDLRKLYPIPKVFQSHVDVHMKHILNKLIFCSKCISAVKLVILFHAEE